MSELETVLTKDKATFPDNPSVWLLDLASLLNLRLENVPENDPLFEDKPAGEIWIFVVEGRESFGHLKIAETAAFFSKHSFSYIENKNT